MQTIGKVVGSAVLAASAVVVPASSALASGTTHTIKVISSNTAGKPWRQEPSFAFTGVDHDYATGVKIGLDMLDCAVNVTTNEAHCDYTLALRGGLLRGTLSFSLTGSSGSDAGMITGGTRAFQHVAGGTIKAVPLGHNELITIAYHS